MTRMKFGESFSRRAVKHPSSGQFETPADALRFSAVVRKPISNERYLPGGPDTPLVDDFQSPPESIWDYIDKHLNRILHQSQSGRLTDGFQISADVITKLGRILYAVCESTSVFPQIVPDGENGLAGVWYADHLSLEILVDSECEAVAIINVDGRIFSVSLDGPDRSSFRSVRGHLADISTHVESVNPGWRRLITE